VPKRVSLRSSTTPALAPVCAKTLRGGPAPQFFEACGFAEREKSQKFWLCAAIRNRSLQSHTPAVVSRRSWIASPAITNCALRQPAATSICASATFCASVTGDQWISRSVTAPNATRLHPKSACSYLSPVHWTVLEGRQRVDGRLTKRSLVESIL
jgi:hypothetical protein